MTRKRRRAIPPTLLKGVDEQSLSPYERECLELGRVYAQANLTVRKDVPELFSYGVQSFKGPVAKESDYFVRKCLGIRLNAIKRGMVVHPSVTPDFLRYIASGGICPVKLEPLVFGGQKNERMNASIDRLVNEVDYRAGNICVLSQYANRAKGEKSFEEVKAIAQAGEDAYGLQGVEWMRLCSLMYGAWSKAFNQGDPKLMPLAAIPPPGTFMTTSQVVQLLLTRLATDGQTHDASYAAWQDLTALAKVPRSRFDELMAALSQALSDEDYPGNAWLHGGVFQAFEDWYNPANKTVVAYIEGVLKVSTERRDDPVAKMLWPLRSAHLH